MAEEKETLISSDPRNSAGELSNPSEHLESEEKSNCNSTNKKQFLFLNLWWQRVLLLCSLFCPQHFQGQVHDRCSVSSC